MWFTRTIFEMCESLREFGISPSFEPGDVVARGFADLGYEEFQVLPGPKLLSLTAGTVAELPQEHIGHFFWIPSVDETVRLLEKNGVEISRCERLDRREWIVCADGAGAESEYHSKSIHEGLLLTLLEAFRRKAAGPELLVEGI